MIYLKKFKTRKSLNKEIDTLKATIEDIKADYKQDREAKEKMLMDLLLANSELSQTSDSQKKKITKLQEELNESKAQLVDSNEKCSKLEKSHQVLRSKLGGLTTAKNEYKKKLEAYKKFYERKNPSLSIDNLIMYNENPKGFVEKERRNMK